MATVAEKSGDLAVPAWGPSDAVDEKVDLYLARRLKAVGNDFKSVALTTFLLAAGVGLVLWLAAGVIADHWLVPGGLARGPRLAWLAIAATAVLAATVRWVVPLVRYRVNLVYAARTIERANPELRNDVVNTVLVRAAAERLPPVIVTSLERRAAKRLSKLPADVVTDRSTAVRLAGVLAMLVAAACLYAVLSPKSLGLSLARLAAPWSRIAAPTRVQIAEPELGWRLPAAEGGGDFHPIAVKNGMGTIVRNRQLVLRTRIRGLSAREEPAVEVSVVAEDGGLERAAAWRTRMEPAAGSGDGVVEATLPGGGHGITGDVVLSVSAGDARSEPVRVVVVDPPSLLVKQLKLTPPAYTRREPELVEWQGDVSGLEGTRVTLLAESKDPLDMAAIDFGCDGHGLTKLRIDPRDLARASGSFELRLSPDRSGPWEKKYQLVFRPRGSGGEGDEPRERGIEHRIAVVADLMPEVRVVEPGKTVVKVPPDKPVAVGVEAVDPDFGLTRVSIEIELERNGERSPRPAQPVLEREVAGPFRGHVVFKPVDVGGRGGDRLHYRAVAVDTKTPSPNASRTEWSTFEIDAAAAPPQLPPDAGRQDGRDGDAGRQDSNAGPGREGSKEAAPSKEAASAGNGSDAAASNDAGRNDAGSEAAGNDGARSQPQGKESSKPSQGESGSGPPEKGTDGQRSKGSGGRTPGSSEPSQQSSDAGESGDASGGGQNSGGKNSGSQNSGSKGDGSKGDGSKGDGSKGDAASGTSSGGRQGKGQSEGGEKSGNKPTESNPAKGNEQGSDPQKNDGQGSSQQGERGNAGDGRRDQAAGARGGTSKGGEGGERQSGDEKPVAADGTNDGEAIERILDQREATERQQPRSDERNSPANEPGDRQDATNKGDANQDGGKAGGPKGDERRRDGQKSDGQKSDGNKSDANKSDANKSDGECAECKDGTGGGRSKTASGGGGKESGSASGSSGSGNADQKPNDGAKKPGAGQSGGGQPADEGGETADQPGGGQAGSQGAQGKPGGNRSGRDDGGKRPGDDPSGREAAGEKSGGEQASAKTGGGRPGDSGKGRAGEDLAGDDPPSDREPGEQAGVGGRAGRGLGGRDPREGGDSKGGVAASKEAEWSGENLAHARNAVDLAVEHLKRSMSEGRRDVLDSLGWNREQAQAFLDRWDRMARAAKEGGPRKQQDFDRAVRSLGLTPQGVRRNGETIEESRGGQAEARRSQPPVEYREQFKAFTQGVRPEGR